MLFRSKASYARLWLGAHAASGMPNASGLALGGGLVEGDPTPFSSFGKRGGASQEKPTCKDAWKLWRRAMKLLASKDGPLKAPLGQWAKPFWKLRRQWPFCYSSSAEALHSWNEGWLKRYAAPCQYFISQWLKLKPWGAPVAPVAEQD